MDIPTRIAAVRDEGTPMASAVAQVAPDDAVPTCPEWTVRDLARHMGGVHRWATGFVRGRTEPFDADLDEVVGTWPPDAYLADWLVRGCSDLADAPDDLRCWTFLPAPSPRAMWARRQAHETAVHRVDAQGAAGIALTPCTPSPGMPTISPWPYGNRGGADDLSIEGESDVLGRFSGAVRIRWS